MTELLQRELTRIADQAQAADIPLDTWERARGSVRRTRLTAVAGAVAAVALVAGLAAWLPQRDSDPPVSDTPGVPDVVHGVGWKELTPTGDRALGRQAVALKSLSYDPVVVDAEDSTYRALDLPGFEGRRGQLRLSPDGLRLAWTWSGGDNLLETVDPRDGIGIRVLDLTTGEFESYDLRDDAGGTFVHRFSWSPDGRWLVWNGMEAGGGKPGGLAAGRIGPDGASLRLPGPTSTLSTLAVADDGVVLVANPDQLVRWDGEVIDTAARSGDRAPVVVTPRDGVLVEATFDQLGRTDDYRLADGTEIPEWEGRAVYPLGRLDDGAVVVLLGGSWEDPTSTEPPPDWVLQLLDASTGRVTTVGTLPSGVNDLAVGLMTSDQPTISRAQSDEPGWRPDTSLLIGLGVAGVLSVLAGLRWLWRRYRAARYASWARTDHSAAPQSDSSTSW